MKLYGYYRSSTSYRTRIVLNLKGIDYEYVPVALDRGEQHDNAFRELNPMGAVPALAAEDGLFVQSPAIIEYLEERHPEPALLPADAVGRARVREIAALIACDIHPVNNLRVMRYIGEHYGQDRDGIGEWYAHWIHAGFGPLERLLAARSAAGRYCIGNAVTLADAYLVPQVYNARRFGVPLDDYPVIESVDAHCAALPAFAAAHPDHQPDAPEAT
ncbi:maleylacetoacetate isomerase [Lentisalinibacter sediminis]|uniref:maleylacetoacetate isomerase n=1 Tax=Lentisalinibacter sediminis TaxID=2992237 RepID=UPI00386DF39C